MLREILFCFALAWLGATSSLAQETPDVESGVLDLVENLGLREASDPLPGVKLAEGVSQLTGVAISPLLGVSVVGGWNYLRTEEADRHRLPLICHPAAWITGLIVLLICFFKDSLGNFLPSFAKKPLDLIELFEDKFSAIIASVGFVPFLVQQYSENQLSVPAPSAGSALSADYLAVTSPSLVAVIPPVWFLLPIALTGFLVVWIVSHAITVIATLSPSRILSIFLKVSRLALLGIMSALYLISPVIAAVLAVVIIAICCFLAPRAFRFSVFGTVISTDFLHSLIWKKTYDPEKLRCFLARRGNASMKARSFGRISLKGDRVTFHRRRWFVGREQELLLPEDQQLVITKGFPFPVIQMRESEKDSWVTIIHLLPRFRHRVEELSETLGLEIQDHPAVRGLKASAQWCRESFKTSAQGQIEA